MKLARRRREGLEGRTPQAAAGTFHLRCIAANRALSDVGVGLVSWASQYAGWTFVVGVGVAGPGGCRSRRLPFGVRSITLFDTKVSSVTWFCIVVSSNEHLLHRWIFDCASHECQMVTVPPPAPPAPARARPRRRSSCLETARAAHARPAAARRPRCSRARGKEGRRPARCPIRSRMTRRWWPLEGGREAIGAEAGSSPGVPRRGAKRAPPAVAGGRGGKEGLWRSRRGFSCYHIDHR